MLGARYCRQHSTYELPSAFVTPIAWELFSMCKTGLPDKHLLRQDRLLLPGHASILARSARASLINSDVPTLVLANVR